MPALWKAEAGRSPVQIQPEQLSDLLSDVSLLSLKSKKKSFVFHGISNWVACNRIKKLKIFLFSLAALIQNYS